MLLLCWLLSSLGGWGAVNQIHAQSDSITLDTLPSLQEINQGPRKALLWSIIPGGGQVYNKRWWKVPLVYGGLLGAVAVLDFNQTRFSRVVTALEQRCLGDGNIIEIPFADCVPTTDEFEGISTQGLVQQRDNLDKQRQTAYVGIFLVYVLQAVEAYTDAHLQDFDISDDISLHVGPAGGDLGAYAGAGVFLRAGGGSVARQEAEVRRHRAAR